MGLFSAIAQVSGVSSAIFSARSPIPNAIAHATNQQIGEIDKAIGEQQREYDTTRSDFQPYMLFGKDALGPLGDLLGMNGGDKAAAAIAALKASPLFTSLFNTGQEATLQNASATGGIRGGNTEGALYELGQGTLAQVIQQQISNLFGAQPALARARRARWPMLVRTPPTISARAIPRLATRFSTRRSASSRFTTISAARFKTSSRASQSEASNGHGAVRRCQCRRLRPLHRFHP
jgi:hypothetical protein